MAKPKLALIPAAQGSKFYSVLPSDGVGDFDFARASAATRINKYGLIETVASGQSRLNYPLIDGVVKGCPHHILEPVRTNLVTYSQSYTSGWIFDDSTITENSTISPDGSLNGGLWKGNTVPSRHNTGALGVGSGVVDASFSLFVKAKELKYIQIASANTVNQYVNFDAENGIIGTVGSDFSTAKIEDYGNGWYRVSVVSPNQYNGYYISLVSGLASIWLESWTMSNNTDGLYIFGAQLELGSYPTSYIVSNSGSATTRVAETANNSGDASTFNDSEGVLMAEISALANDLTYRQISLTEDGGGGDVLTIDLSSSSNGVRTFLYVNGSAISLSSTLSDETDFNKIAVKYGSTHELWVNGLKVGSQLLSLLPITLNKLTFDNGSGANDFYGKTKQLQYFDSALNDSELETLTSWTSFSEMATSQLYSIQ